MADNYLVRENNISRLKEMLAKLGNQEYEAAVAHLAEDVYCDWPYLPAPGLSESMTGKDNLRSFFEGGMSAFEPYKYKFTAIHAALDPNKLIAEYYSDSRHLSTGHPYGNKYISIFKFSDGKITYWREYLNPLPIHEVLQASRELQQTD